MTKHAIIVGGGIGGVTAALCLHRIGWRVTVLERAARAEEIGAGVQISPNGMRILDALGVTPLLEAVLFEPETIEMRVGATGRRLFSIPMRAIAERRWGARYIQIHRADLLAGLSRTLADKAPDALKFGAEVVGYEQGADAATAILKDGQRIEADLVVGADGVRSTLRDQMLGPDQPRFTGNVAWRAMAPIEALGVDAPPPGGCIWAGPGKHAVTTRVRAGSMANFVGIVEQADWREEGWRLEGRREDALADFGGWDPALAGIIRAAPVLYRWALFDRPPLSRWSDGRVVLLGDACHPMLPSMAQGAVQAMEDAWALSTALSHTHNVAQACADYFSARIERATRVQNLSTANVRLFHRRTLARRIASYGPIWLAARAAPGLIHRRQDWLYGFDPTDF